MPKSNYSKDRILAKPKIFGSYRHEYMTDNEKCVCPYLVKQKQGKAGTPF